MTNGLDSRSSDGVRTHVANCVWAKDNSAGPSFWRHDSQVDFVGFVRNGSLRIQRYSWVGLRQIITALPSRKIVEQATSKRVHCEFEAATGPGLRRLARCAFRRLMLEQQKLRRAVIFQYVERLKAIPKLTCTHLLLTAKERLCASLVLGTWVMPCQSVHINKLVIIDVALTRGLGSRFGCVAVNGPTTGRAGSPISDRSVWQSLVSALRQREEFVIWKTGRV